MKKTALLAGLLIAWPFLTQNLSAQNEPAQNPPPAASPKLEQPQMAAPEPEDEKKPDKKPEKKTDAPAPKVARTAESEGKIVEEIIARVNNDIITKSEYEKARAQAEEDARQDCSGRCTSEQLQTAIEDRQKGSLRDLIDQSLLAQRGKDMGISVETELVKKLDELRIANKLKDMDELEKAVTSQGMNWDDFRGNMRNRLLTQAVIGKEVGSHITITHEEALKYYDAHKSEFVKPEQVALRSIEIHTDGKTPPEIVELRKKIDGLVKRVQDGEDFGELAKRFSDGSTASQNGYLGIYKRGELSKEFEAKVFVMKKREMTDVIETKQGFLVLQVLERYEEGEQPYEKVENEIMDHLYSQGMDPALREYLKTLREQSYVVIKPGYQEMAGSGNSEIQEVSTTPETSKEKKARKKYLLFGKTTAEPKS
jgi:peptidyl-prolyl cis-trans isomerase SurA